MMHAELYGVDLEFDGQWITATARNAVTRGALGDAIRRFDSTNLISMDFHEAKLLTNGKIEFRDTAGTAYVHFRRKQSSTAKAIYDAILAARKPRQPSTTRVEQDSDKLAEAAMLPQSTQMLPEPSATAPATPLLTTSNDSEIEINEEFSRALTILESGSNMFLTGKAGTGKSTLIRHFMNTTDRNVVVIAPTGIAALNVDGFTIHRLFSFGSTTTLDEVRGQNYYPGRFDKVLKRLDTLIIDEASMVRSDLLDQIAIALERFGPHPGKTFGGVQIVLVGDLFQLPPVVKEAEKGWLESQYETPYFFSAKSFSNETFPTISLTKVFRQLNDSKLTGLLNAVREGILVDQMRSELNTRTKPEFVPPDNEFWLTVAPTNSVVASRNRQALDRLSSTEYQHNAVTSGDISMFDSPVEEVLRFKVGAQVMLLNNDASGRWVNGSLGKITAIEDAGEVVSIELNKGTVVDVEPHTWEVTNPAVEDGVMRRKVVGTYTQLPFKLAWAITIHKCQGQTLDRLIVDLSGGVFDFGQAYVALSRCTNMEGLVLKRDVLAKDLRTDRRVLRFLNAATTVSGPRKHCAIGVLTVGAEGRMDRPRPIEIAIAFEDGAAISTLLNPERDLTGAREQYNITVDDILLAPTLVEAWPVLAAALAGYTPVGIGLDHSLGLVDFELKRLGVVQRLPLANDLPDISLTSIEQEAIRGNSALSRARAALTIHHRLRNEDLGSTQFEIPEDELLLTYLLSRDYREPIPALTESLSSLLTTSQIVSAAVLDGKAPKAQPDDVESTLVRDIVASRLTSAISKSAGLPSSIRQRLAALTPFLGTTVLSEILVACVVQSREVLYPGARVCFTGDAVDSDGRSMTRDELQQYCERIDLIPVDSMTKTRCDVLVVAEMGTQSGKARKAKEYGKPVISVEQFLRWDPSDFIKPPLALPAQGTQKPKRSKRSKATTPRQNSPAKTNRAAQVGRLTDANEALRLQRQGWSREEIGEQLGGRSVEAVKSLLSDAKFYEDPTCNPGRLALAHRAAELRNSGLTLEATIRALAVSKNMGTRACRDAQIVLDG